MRPIDSVRIPGQCVASRASRLAPSSAPFPMRLPTSCTALVLLGVLASASSAQQLVHDDFDRPNSTNLGPDWVEANNDLEIFGNTVRGKNAFLNDTWMYHSGFAEPHATAKAVVDFGATPGDTFFGVSVVIGLDHTTWGGTAVRVTDNDLDGLFDRIFFNAAINAGAWYTQPTPIWYDLPAGIPAGQLTVWAEPGDDMVVARVEDLAGNLVGTYTASGIAASPFAPTGTDVGVWISSRARADEFFALEHRPLDAFPTSLSLAAGGEQILDVSFGSAHAGELYLVVSGASGTAPVTPIGGGVDLPLALDSFTIWSFQHPNQAPYSKSLGFLDAQGHARARITLPPGSLPSLAGVLFHHAAISVSTTGPTAGAPTAATNAASLQLLP